MSVCMPGISPSSYPVYARLTDPEAPADDSVPRYPDRFDFGTPVYTEVYAVVYTAVYPTVYPTLRSTHITPSTPVHLKRVYQASFTFRFSTPLHSLLFSEFHFLSRLRIKSAFPESFCFIGVSPGVIGYAAWRRN